MFIVVHTGTRLHPERRDGDSNPGYPLGVYTLSRRASSTTRASLLIYNFLKSAANYKKFANHQHFQLQMYSLFLFSHRILRL